MIYQHLATKDDAIEIAQTIAKLGKVGVVYYHLSSPKGRPWLATTELREEYRPHAIPVCSFSPEQMVKAACP